MITLFAAALFFMGCSDNDTLGVHTKDVSFKIAVKCDDLTFNDYYGSTLVQSVHQSNVDTAYVQLNGMAYGKHELELLIDGKSGRGEFVVCDSTAKAYTLSAVNVGFVFDDERDDELTYEY